jgi:signal transduction histidine kinase
LAQLLGYVNTKAMAVRLMVTNGNLPAAEEHLMQLEEAARALFVDVREVILGLKLTRPDGEGNFLPTLSELAQQFERLSGLTIQLRLGSGLDDLKLPPEAEIQLVRIAQEALTNARKHSRAGSVQLEVQRTDGLLEMAIRDDGQGFDLSGIESRRGASFGLEAMRERAQAVGATLELESRPGGGTAVVVRLPDERG